MLGIKAETVIISRQKPYVWLKDWIKAFVSHVTKDKKFYLFWKFTNTFTNPRYFYCNKNVVNRRILHRYNAFSTGSDQVWNSKYLNNETKDLVLKERLLAFVAGEKRMSFAASFSLPEIPLADIEIFKTELQKFPMLLVREEQGANILNHLYQGTAKEKVSVILDPTLMLPGSYWKNIASADICQEGNYILEIFICPPSEAARRVSEKLQKEMSCKCIDLMGDNEISRKTGPLQFLELISRAKYICTDSFHAVAFSLLFNKQFLVFERSDHSQKKDSRFETLFSKLNINREVLSDDSSSEELNGFIEKTIDYSKIEPLLESEREKSWQQIKKALRYIGLGD